MPRTQRHDPTAVADPAVLSTVATSLRERLYGAITLLALVQGLLHIESDHPVAVAVVTVLITTAGLWGASLTAGFVAHTAVHGPPTAAEVRHELRSSGQIIQAAIFPALALAGAAVDLWSLHTALVIATVGLVATVGLAAGLAARRTPFGWFGRLVLVAAVLAIALLVVAVKALVH